MVYFEGEERSTGWISTPCSVAGLPVRSGTSTSGLSTAEAVSGTRGRDGELDKENRRAVLEDGK